MSANNASNSTPFTPTPRGSPAFFPSVTYAPKSWSPGGKQVSSDSSLTAELEVDREARGLTDVTFRFPSSKTEVSAHKIVLALKSSVFKTMFFQGGRWKEGEEASSIVDIVDYSSPPTFDLFVRLLYSMDAAVPSVQEALDLLYLVVKYDVPTLKEGLVAYLEASLSLHNLGDVLTVTNVLENLDLLQDRVLKAVDLDATRFLQSPGFKRLDRASLAMILKRDTLNAKEPFIFDALVEWGKASLRDRSPSPSKLREAIGSDLLHLIRFPTMDGKTFASGPWSSILSQEERLAVFLSKFGDKENQVFPTTPRKGGLVLTIPPNCACIGTPSRRNCSFCAEDTMDRSRLVQSIHCNCATRFYCPRRSK